MDTSIGLIFRQGVFKGKSKGIDQAQQQYESRSEAGREAKAALLQCRVQT